MRQTFANRFEPDGDGFLYRASPTAAPIRVTSHERDAFVATFNRRLTWLYWGMVAMVVGLIGGYAAIVISLNTDFSQFAVFVGMGLVMTAYLGAWYWMWTAPRRTLEGRATSGPARTKEQARRAALAKVTWAQIAGAALLVGLGALRIGWREDLLQGWNRLWLVFFAVCFAAVALGAYRKWRFDREAGVGRRRPSSESL